MPIDMKTRIAQAVGVLLMEKNKKRLTVKDIVEECQITRQAFYYHFEGIPQLLQWMLEKNMEKTLEGMQSQESPEQRLRYFFLMAINAEPFLKKGLRSNYREEMEQLMTRSVYALFEQAVETERLYRYCSAGELKLLLRYHSQAVIGLLRQWTEEDTKNLDQIVRTICQIISGRFFPEREALSDGFANRNGEGTEPLRIDKTSEV